MYFLPANRLRLYRNFKAIEAHDFYGMIRFYERFEDGIRSLDFEEFFDCTLTYIDALLETAQYGKHVVMCDQMLEYIIMNNIETWGGVDIYAKILHEKAISLFYLQEYPDSEHVLRELIKIHPWGNAYLSLLKKCLLRQKPSWLMTVRAVSVFLFLSSAVLIALQLFILKPHFPQFEKASIWAHYGTLATGLMALLLGESYHMWKSHASVRRFASRIRKTKKV
jgi:hypothetical protein